MSDWVQENLIDVALFSSDKLRLFGCGGTFPSTSRLAEMSASDRADVLLIAPIDPVVRSG